MGTNYYLLGPAKASSAKNAEEEVTHIGKSSGGWCFSLHVMPEEGIHDLVDWEKLWAQPGTCIKNEYGDLISLEKMRDVIMNRSWGDGESFSARFKPGVGAYSRYPTEAAFHRANYSRAGEHGLLRHEVDNQHCLSNGTGTWDCIAGTFS
ncbi:MAG: hypothetical protein Q7S87_00805 [Agitococcus sp.]|nr:hypothetical protein [Agitococcus sp.]MDO9177139.1 hypothetical protein [Agitococcus sp.]